MSYNIFKAGRSSKDGLDMNLERRLGKHCSHEVQPANSRESAPANFDILTCLREVGGVVGGLRYLTICSQALPFSLPAVFRSLTFSLLSCFFHFSFPFFLSSRLTESLAQTTVNLNQKSRIPHCNLIWIDSKIETYKIA